MFLHSWLLKKLYTTLIIYVTEVLVNKHIGFEWDYDGRIIGITYIWIFGMM